ncbi:MAG: VCBS repeat-containing protein, partial [Propionibacteriaceae bacterium]|nr:VCBS repeat-containing protein [Propionibacteriaceae bacterium]
MPSTGGHVRLVDCSFEDFQAGEMGNAGHNLYVSKAGVLQRIALTSLTGSGYVDIPFANAHDDAFNIPAYLCTDPLHSDDVVELGSNGAYAGAVGDLTGDGFDDIVIANQYDGVSNEVNAQIYFGSPSGYSRKRMLQLWAPSSKDVAIGAFARGARPAIVFVSRERLRVFEQSDTGFAAGRYKDVVLDHGIDSITVADLDGDGVDDLVVRAPDSTIHVYWGGDGGISAARSTKLDIQITGERTLVTSMDLASMSAGALGGTAPTGLFVYSPPTESRVAVVHLDGRPHLFLCPESTALFVAFDASRVAEVRHRLESGPVMSAAAGDIRGVGATDIVLASRQTDADGNQFSLVYWGGTGEPERIESQSANDVAIVDLSGDGCGDVVICQDKTDWLYSTESLVYRASASGLEREPRRIPTHCALDVLFPISPVDGLPKPLFINHTSNTTRGNIDSYVYLGGPDGYSPERRLELPGWAAISMKYVDLADRGRPDVLMTNTNENYPEVDNGSFIYRSDENGEFSVGNRIELPTRHSMSTVVADLNRDGYLDIVACGWQNDHIQVFYGGPDGFGESVDVGLRIDGVEYADPRFMSIGDLNRDGYLDLVIPVLGRAEGLIVLWGGPDGFDGRRATVLDSGGVVSSRVADLDGDGWLDLIIGGFKGNDPLDDYRTFVYIYWGGPDGFSNDRRTELPANFPADVAVADLDNDGILDVVVANYHGYRNRDIDSTIYWGAP